MVAEELSIRDLRSILQTLVDAYDPTLDAVALTEIVRSHSKVYITHKYSHGEPTLDCQLLAPETEAVLRGHLQGARTDLQATLPPDFVRALFSAIRSQVGGERPTSPTPVIVTAPELRPYLRDLLKEDFPHLAILSRAEISDDVELKPTGSISVPTPGDPPKPESD
jgi:type III secretion protein V